MRKLMLLALVVALGLVGLAAPAVAAPPITETTTVQGAVLVLEGEFGPICDDVGPLYDITLTYNEVIHTTVFADGREHFKQTQTGTFEAVPLNGGTFHSGHFAAGGFIKENKNGFNFQFTFNLNGQFEGGEKFSLHEVEHGNVPPTGVAHIFDRCHE